MLNRRFAKLEKSCRPWELLGVAGVRETFACLSSEFEMDRLLGSGGVIEEPGAPWGVCGDTVSGFVKPAAGVVVASAFAPWPTAVLFSVANRAGEVVLAGAGVANDAGCVRLPGSGGNEKPRQGESLENGVEGREMASASAARASALDSALPFRGSPPKENRETRAAKDRLSPGVWKPSAGFGVVTDLKNRFLVGVGGSSSCASDTSSPSMLNTLAFLAWPERTCWNRRLPDFSWLPNKLPRTGAATALKGEEGLPRETRDRRPPLPP